MGTRKQNHFTLNTSFQQDKSMKPRLLDLFCGAGGCSYGYAQAGFEVVGVDSEPQPHYPFEFHQADALTYPLQGFDVIHASPVCKGYTECNRPNQRSTITKDAYPKLIDNVRERLLATGSPYIIENVMGAKHDLNATLMLCATMFGLPMERERLFEIGNTDLFILPPGPCNHKIAHISVVGHSVWDSWKEGTRRKDGRRRPDSVPVEIGHKAMGIDWMNKEELAQAIPPAYTYWIGKQLIQYYEELSA
jgi:DNA (cytosine-5)-methyltransferase 1